MRWALNMQKGTTVIHPAVGKLQGGVAYQVSDKEAVMLKHIINVVVFDDVKFRDKEVVVETTPEPEMKPAMVEKLEAMEKEKDKFVKVKLEEI